MRLPYLVTATNERASQLDFLSSVTFDQLDQIDHKVVAFWAIDASDVGQAISVLQSIRRSQLPAIYLKPILFLTHNMAIESHDLLCADSCCSTHLFDSAMVEKQVSDFEQINQWIDALPKSSSVDSNIAFKILRFIASRNREFAPILSVAYTTGFLYPQLQPFFERRDIGILQTIDFLHAQNLLLPHFFKKAHFCSHCDCAFLNFEEICPHCSSNDLNMDELIHHFKCAYTGELADFRRDDNLVCPKCDKTLRHIGVDYDKPSTVYRCNQCAHSFQEPLVTSTCYSCGRTTEPENQVLRTIQSYSISSIGENAARYGMESLFANIMETEIKLISFSSFNDFYKIEAARIERYKKSTSSLVLFGFDNLDELYIQLGKRAKNIFVELSAVFKSVLRSSDLITARNESVFIVIMTETDTANAERAVERLKEGVTVLFENNLDYKPTLFTRVQEIDPESDPEKMLEQFL